MIKLNLPWPPSVNGYWRNFRGRQIISAKGRSYRQDVAGIWQHAKQEPMLEGNLLYWAILVPPDKRRRDLDNFAHKAIWDGLKAAGAIKDDSQFKGSIVEIGEPMKGGRVEVRIVYHKPSLEALYEATDKSGGWT